MAISITIPRGNTETRTITVTDSNGSAFDMTDYTLLFIVKLNLTDADADTRISNEVVFSSPATGIGVLSFDHDDTDLETRNYQCEFKLYKADGSFIRTLDIGILTISKVVLLEIPA
jgi:hypothetical protein